MTESVKTQCSADSGQATPLFLALTVALLAFTMVAFGVIKAVLELDRRQAFADVAALAGADALRLGRSAADSAELAERVALVNHMRADAVVPDAGSQVPIRMRVSVRQPLRVGIGPAAIDVSAERSAEAIVAQPVGMEVDPGPGDYAGPFAWRQGKPMRPDVAIAFDRLAGVASSVGVGVVIASAWRSTAEQARLFAAHPDPKWVAPPGRSLHRLGTELDLGPPSAYSWLAANAGRFGFLKRYSWEPWHFGYTRSPGSSSVGWGPSLRRPAGRGATADDRRSGGSAALQPWVPARFRQLILQASIRNGVSAAVLAAQLRAESNFEPNVQSSAGAQGMAGLMPFESRRQHVNPFDPAQAIAAQARLMRELLSRFGSVPLALAAYNAGPNAVARCGCIPPYTETRTYVARILRWLGGTDGRAGPAVVLVA